MYFISLFFAGDKFNPNCLPRQTKKLCDAHEGYAVDFMRGFPSSTVFWSVWGRALLSALLSFAAIISQHRLLKAGAVKKTYGP